MAIDLLVRHGDKHDYPELARALLACPADSVHGLGMGYISFTKHHPSRAAVPGLLHLYEHGPCTFCRTGIVRRLLRLSALPPALREECQYDAAEDTRMLVRGWPRV